jgi:hypothetical protein
MDARALRPGVHVGAATEHWGFIAGELGATVGARLPRPLLIGIRGVGVRDGLTDLETHELVARPAYDDAFICLTPEAVPPYVFPGATHPYQTDSRLSPDIDHDGRGDVGCIRPGHFELTLALEKPYPIFTLTLPGGSGNIPCFRDTSHDGKYSAAELSQMSFATAVLLHTGFDAPPDSEHRSSIACQTCNVADLRYLASHARPYGRKLDYILADAADVIAIAERSPFRDAAPESIA